MPLRLKGAVPEETAKARDIGRRLDSKSRMSGDAHVRICESLGVKFPRATRLFVKINGETHYLW